MLLHQMGSFARTGLTASTCWFLVLQKRLLNTILIANKRTIFFTMIKCINISFSVN